MRLSQQYQPVTLDDVVGQPAIVRRLQRLVAAPCSCCLLFEGRGGVGKSRRGQGPDPRPGRLPVLGDCPDFRVNENGTVPFDGAGLVEYSASNLSIEEVRRLFGQTFRYRPMAGNPWHILLIEELELIVSRHVNAALKDELSEQHMPERLIVVATSNDASGLDEALLQRFDIFPFSAGPTFAEACQERLGVDLGAGGRGGRALASRRGATGLAKRQLLDAPGAGGP